MRRSLLLGALCLALPLTLWGCGESGSNGAGGAGGDEAASSTEPVAQAEGAAQPDATLVESAVGAAEPVEAAVEAPLVDGEGADPAVLGTPEGISSAPAVGSGFAVADAPAAYGPVYGGGVTSQEGISVSGAGQVQVVPDAAQITFGVDTQADTADAALAANAKAMEQVIAALQQAGIARKDIQTQQVSVGQRYDQQGLKVIGYGASNQVVATVRAIDSTGAVMDAAVKAGATNVYGLGLVVSNPDEAYAKALDQAAAAARVKAERLAKAAGVTLGKVVGLAEGGGGYGGPIPLAAEAARDAKTPIEVGTQLVTASVTVTYAVG